MSLAKFLIYGAVFFFFLLFIEKCQLTEVKGHNGPAELETPSLVGGRLW